MNEEEKKPQEEQPAEQAAQPTEEKAAEETTAEEKPAESAAEQSAATDLPEYTKPTYVASSILVAKAIDDLDTDIEADETVRVNTLKDYVECFPTARFTKIAKTKAIVTAEPDQMQRLTDNLKKTFKRTIMVTAL